MINILLNGLWHFGFRHYCRSVDQIPNSEKTEKVNKEEDDAHSTTSYDLYTITLKSLCHPCLFISFRIWICGIDISWWILLVYSFSIIKIFIKLCLYAIRSATPRRRSSGSGFSFRLEERAEKRKEVVAATLHPIDIVIANAIY